MTIVRETVRDRCLSPRGFLVAGNLSAQIMVSRTRTIRWVKMLTVQAFSPTFIETHQTRYADEFSLQPSKAPCRTDQRRRRISRATTHETSNSAKRSLTYNTVAPVRTVYKPWEDDFRATICKHRSRVLFPSRGRR